MDMERRLESRGWVVGSAFRQKTPACAALALLQADFCLYKVEASGNFSLALQACRLSICKNKQWDTLQHLTTLIELL